MSTSSTPGRRSTPPRSSPRRESSTPASMTTTSRPGSAATSCASSRLRSSAAGRPTGSPPARPSSQRARPSPCSAASCNARSSRAHPDQPAAARAQGRARADRRGPTARAGHRRGDLLRPAPARRDGRASTGLRRAAPAGATGAALGARRRAHAHRARAEDAPPPHPAAHGAAAGAAGARSPRVAARLGPTGRRHAGHPGFKGTARERSAEWTEVGYEQWITRVWMPALERVGTRVSASVRPAPLVRLAAVSRGAVGDLRRRQLGHSAAVCMRTYGHVIEELDEAPRISAEDAIPAARRGEVFGHCSDAPRASDPSRGKPLQWRVGGTGLEPVTSCL